MRIITNELVLKFKEFLIEDCKSENTIDKYVRDINFFEKWLNGREVTRALVHEYKKDMCEKYAPTSVNAALSSLNTFFAFAEWSDLRVKVIKIHKVMFLSKEKELTKSEYENLLNAAKRGRNQRLYFLMQTICSTGIRVSELKFITVEALKRGKAIVDCKGKMRVVFFPKELCKLLNSYIKANDIQSGAVFVSRNGKPLDRSHIWQMLKNLCEIAGVSKEKVFPHNLRHLFARTYYNLQKDIVRLADILGHSSINTTRIYTMETGEIHCRQIQKLGLLRC